ncbi:MAG: DUF418 domain-containing protein [Oxalicibacterium faecigallinarum]|uniref:DUF418 domain-containing protein n=1 Tax=Oxalicibacterium faecigallinarum TaxID=573741 RepID=UPI0028078918|nr:DUF418 domain-containing protein [Oxalicibacterium faecigallinarum]MDQ7968876.1 DUF418 domain-containing protein [Oxalicibacterium faecigallinarum]
MTRRIERIDALRGLAVFGILLVNLWSYVWGFESLRYGVLQPDASLLDVMAIAFTAFFAEQKFYPIFAFLFGASAILITQSVFRQTGRWSEAQRLYRRRLLWLLACGVVHGVLIWFGDILTFYALVGLWVLLGIVGVRARTLLSHLRWWTLAFIVLVAIGVWLGMQSLGPEEAYLLATSAVEHVEAARQVYTYGNFLSIGWQRLQDYLTVTAQSLLILPHLAMLFLLGAWSVRRGWLTRPHRHRRLWKHVLIAGLLVGLPFNVLWAVLKVTEAADPLQPWRWDYLAYALLPVGGSFMAAAIVALFMLASAAWMRNIAFVLAPVGRMALSNYLAQSLLGVILFQGFGFGLGQNLRPASWMAIAFAIMACQILLSRWWLSRHAQGPLESWSRRFIHRSVVR